MDRKIFYPQQIPLSAQFLQSEKNTMIGMAYIAEAVFGTPTLVDGLSCTGMTPASLTVQIGPGQIYQLEPTDGSMFGSLAPDNTHNIVKQGINVNAATFTLVPPGIAGQSVCWLIQAALNESDADNLALPYVNSNNPSQPWVGPGNSGDQQPTTRKCTVALSSKMGLAATTGTQVAPVADPGYVGLWVITVPYGATTLDGNNIAKLPSAPFLFKHLPELPYWVQSGEFLWGNDAGSANVIAASLTPLPPAYKAGMHVFVRKMNAANTGNVTANFNGLGAVAVLDVTGAQIGAGNMTAGMVLHLVYDGTSFRWINGNITNTSISSLTGTSGEGITVSGDSPYPISLNFPGLSTATPTALDLFAFYDNEGGHHRVINWASLLALLNAQVTSQQLSTVGPVAMFTQERAGGAAAENFSLDSWARRTLNTSKVNQISGCSLSTGQISLPAGSYRVRFAGNASWNAFSHQARIYDATHAAILAIGATVRQTGEQCVPSQGIGFFTLASAAIIEMQHYAKSSVGGGYLPTMGDGYWNIAPNTHCDGWIEIIKEA